MSRYEPRERIELDDDQAALYDMLTSGPRAAQANLVRLTDNRGRLLGPFGPMTIQPTLGDAIQQVGASIRFATSLTDRVREASILLVATHHQSPQEWALHAPAALSAGMDEGALQEIQAGRVPHAFAGAERIALEVVVSLLHIGNISDVEYHAANEQLGERQFAEVVWLVGYYSLLALALRVWNPTT